LGESILERLLGSLSAQTFFNGYWDRKPVLLEGDGEGFQDLFSIEQFERRLTESDLRVPGFKVAQHGREISEAEFTCQRVIGGIAISDFIDVAAVYSLWNEGATIVLHSLQQCGGALGDWLQLLEVAVGHPTQANAYLTPPGAQGLSRHCDTHDVFVLQVEGTKVWRVWNAPADSKLLGSKPFGGVSGLADCDSLAIDAELQPGQVLYMPSGYFHEAHSTDKTSLHVTVGVHVYRRIDALKAVFERIVEDLEENDSLWRASLTRGYSVDGDAAFSSMRESVLEKLGKSWGLTPLVEAFQRRGRPFNQQLLAVTDRVSRIDDESLFEIEPCISLLFREEGDMLTLIYAGRQLDLPIAASLALRKMLELRRFAVSQLEEYDAESRRALCRRLLLDGFLRFAD